MTENTGWSSDWYKLPEGATELQDLIEHRRMNFAMGNIFKATYRHGEKDGTTLEYDLYKIIWFANRELARLKRERGKDENVNNQDHSGVRNLRGSDGTSGEAPERLRFNVEPGLMQRFNYNSLCACDACANVGRSSVGFAVTGLRCWYEGKIPEDHEDPVKNPD